MYHTRTIVCLVHGVAIVMRVREIQVPRGGWSIGMPAKCTKIGSNEDMANRFSVATQTRVVTALVIAGTTLLVKGSLGSENPVYRSVPALLGCDVNA